MRPRCLTPGAALAVALVTGCASAPLVHEPARETGPPITSWTAVPTAQLFARADSAWALGAYPVAMLNYERAIARDSSNSRAVFRLATLRAWDNQMPRALELFRRYILLEPRDTEGRVAYARAISWSGKYADAIAVYDSVLVHEPTYRGAVIGRAQTLAWSGHLNESLAAHRQWLETHPDDREAWREYARVLSWNGQLDDAERVYGELVRGGDVDAEKGIARLAAWRGEMQRSTDLWESLIAAHPDDPEALTGLAQVLSWQDRPRDAEVALRRALIVGPEYGDARTLLRSIEAELRPSISVSDINTNDSDQNRLNALFVDYRQLAPWGATVGGRFAMRRAKFSATDSRSEGGSLFALWQPPRWQLRADAGFAQQSSTVGTVARSRVVGNGALHALGRVSPLLTVGADVARAPFDETAQLIANGVVSTDITAQAEYALPARFTLAGVLSHAQLSGGSRDNARNTIASSVRWARNRNWSAAAGVRAFGYDTTSSDGYFAPRRYVLTELSGRGHKGGELGWNADGELGIGRQSIEFFGSSAGSRLAERALISSGYRFSPAREVTVLGSYANVASPGQTGGSEYHNYSLSVRFRRGL